MDTIEELIDREIELGRKVWMGTVLRRLAPIIRDAEDTDAANRYTQRIIDGLGCSPEDVVRAVARGEQ